MQIITPLVSSTGTSVSMGAGESCHPQLEEYDRIIVAFSGGKDSMACVLHLLEKGIAPDRIHLHHHLVDGRESTLIDWPCTEAYCNAIASAMRMQIFALVLICWFCASPMARKSIHSAPLLGHFYTRTGTSRTIGPVSVSFLGERKLSNYIEQLRAMGYEVRPALKNAATFRWW